MLLAIGSDNSEQRDKTILDQKYYFQSLPKTATVNISLEFIIAVQCST